jgi:tetratricopeptide (TPR) repeat protein
MINDNIKLANIYIKNGKIEHATKILEYILIIEPRRLDLRLNLAILYIKLKENNFRSKARSHLEYIIPRAKGEILKNSLKILLNNVYLTNGPISKVKEYIKKYEEDFDPYELSLIISKLKENDLFLVDNNKKNKRSKLPDRVNEFVFFDSAIEKYIFSEFNEQVKKLDKPTKFFTFGSCFAGNVAREMKKQGIDVGNFWVGEDINTTFSNVNLIKYILGLKVDHEDYYKTILTNQNIITLKSELTSCDSIIFTLGVSPAFFDLNGNYIPHSPSNIKNIVRSTNNSYRMSTINENFEKLEELMNIIKKHTSVKNLFLTVSPVPMAASLISQSTPVDDMESKSILRTVAGKICREYPDFYIYFPSYEVFRWLPCFRQESAFGSDDGDTRHTNQEMVSKVVATFIKLTNSN